MSNSIIPAVIWVIVGIISTLLAIFLTPRIQHYFWVYQRLSDIRLAVIRELNNLAVEFLNNYLDAHKYHPTDQFFKSFMAMSASIKALFSKKTFDCFKEFELMIGPNLDQTRVLPKHSSSHETQHYVHFTTRLLARLAKRESLTDLPWFRRTKGWRTNIYVTQPKLEILRRIF